MNHRYAQILRFADILYGVRLAFEENFAGVGLVYARKHFHQRRLARAVLSDRNGQRNSTCPRRSLRPTRELRRIANRSERLLRHALRGSVWKRRSFQVMRSFSVFPYYFLAVRVINRSALL